MKLVTLERQNFSLDDSGFVNPFNCDGTVYCLDDFCFAACAITNALSKDSAYKQYNIGYSNILNVLHAYVTAVQSGKSPFTPTDSGVTTVNAVVSATGYTQDTVYAILYTLYTLAQQGEPHCGGILNVAAPSTSPNALQQMFQGIENALKSLGIIGTILPWALVIGGGVWLYSYIPKPRRQAQ